MKKRSLAFLLALVLALSSLAGCGGQTDSSSSSSGADSSGSDTQQQSDSTPAPAQTEAVGQDLVSGKVDEVNIASERDPTDMGPWAGNMGGASAIIPLVYESLQIQELNSDPEPCLAKSVTEVDTLTYDVELFDYIVDSAGNHMTANDIAFGVDAANELGKAPLTSIDSIEVTGDYTFTVHFNETARMGDFETFFRQQKWVTQAAYEASGDNMAQHPIGTGRYELADYTSGSTIQFVERENYWQTDEQYIARSSEAHASVINYPIITEAMSRAIAIESGQLDYGSISYTDLSRLQTTENVGIYEVPDNLTFMLFANMSDGTPTASSKELREAIFYALDNTGIASLFSSGYAVPVWDLSNSNYPDYYEDEYKAGAADNIYGYDTDKAKDLLASSGYDTSRPIKLLCSSDQVCTDIAEIIKTYLGQIGLDVSIDAYQGTMMSTVAEDPSNWDFYLLQYASTDYAVNVWEKVLNKTKYTWGGTINFVVDETLQEMLSDVRTADGHTKEAVIAFHDYVVEGAWGIGLVQAINYFAYRTDKISTVVMSEQRIIRPNACIFAE